MIDARIRMLAVVALCAGLSACTFWSNDFDNLVDQSGRDFSRDPGKVYRDIDFREMVKAPYAFTFSDVRFVARLDRRGENIFIPMYGSRFKSEDYIGVSLWPIDAKVWDASVRTSSVPTFFISKQNPDLGQLMKLDRFTEMAVRARVHGDFGDLPWVEILYIDPVAIHSTTRAKYVLEVEEAGNLLMASAPLYQEIAAQAGALPDDPAALRDLLAKAKRVREDLSQAQFRYKMSLYHAPDPIATRNRIEQIDGLLDTLAEIIQAIEDKQSR